VNVPVSPFFLLAACVLTLHAAAAADEIDSVSLLQQADAARAEWRLEDAERLCLQSITTADAAPDPAGVRIEANNTLGLLKLQLEQFDKAIAYFQTALDQSDPSDMAHVNRHITVASNLGIAYNNKGDYAKAQETFAAVLAIKSQTLQEGDPALIDTLRYLANAYEKLEQYQSAVTQWQRILEIHHQVSGPDAADVAMDNDAIAVQFQSMNDHAQARKYLEDSVRIREALNGPWHLDVINSLYRLVLNYQADQKLDAALETNTLALQRATKLLGVDSPVYLPILQRQLELCEALNQADQVAILTAQQTRLQNISDWNARLNANGQHANAGHVDEAFTQLTVLQTEAATFGPHSTPVAHAKYQEALLLSMRGQFQEASAATEAGIVIESQVLGENHPIVAASWTLLANYQASAQEPEEKVVVSLQRASKSNSDSGFPNRDLEQSVLYQLAAPLGESGKIGEAMALLEKSFQLRRDLEMPTGFRDAEIVNRFGVLHYANSSPATAVPFFTRAKEILQEVAPESSLFAQVDSNLKLAQEAAAQEKAQTSDGSPSPPTETNAAQDTDTTTKQSQDWTWTIIGCLVSAWYSQRRGYSPVLWIILTLVTSMIVALSVLAILPNRKVQKLRSKELFKLEQLLLTTVGTPVASSTDSRIPDVSIGDLATRN